MKPPIIRLSDLAKHLGLTVDYLYKIMQGRYTLHHKHNVKTVEFYTKKRKELNRYLESLEKKG